MLTVAATPIGGAMSTDAPDPHDDPTEQVIPSSRGYWLLSAIGLGLFAFAYGFTLWDGWVNRGHQILPVEFDSALTVLGWVAVPSCVLLTFVCLYRFVFPFHLAVGADRLRVVRPGRSGPAVLLQIPYANVAEVKYEAGGVFPRLGIRLIDRADPGTYSRGGFGVEVERNGEVLWDYCLKDCFGTDLEEIAHLIVARWRPPA
jgi:hypothetical protein